jgi:hypothetical protein
MFFICIYYVMYICVDSSAISKSARRMEQNVTMAACIVVSDMTLYRISMVSKYKAGQTNKTTLSTTYKEQRAAGYIYRILSTVKAHRYTYKIIPRPITRRFNGNFVFSLVHSCFALWLYFVMYVEVVMYILNSAHGVELYTDYQYYRYNQ